MICKCLQYRLLVGAALLLAIWMCPVAHAQTAFLCEGQVYAFLPLTEEVTEVTVSPLNNALRYRTIAQVPGMRLNVLAFRRSDRLLYGIDVSTGNILQIGADGGIQTFGNIALPSELAFRAGEITPDGRYLVYIGSSNGRDRVLLQTDLESPQLNTTSVTITESFLVSDIAFHPVDQRLFAFDALQDKFLIIDPQTGQTQFLDATITAGNAVEGPFFNAFGDLHAYGSTASNVSSAVFIVDGETGTAQIKTTGPETLVEDITAAPYFVDIECRADPRAMLPCNPLSYIYRIGNSAGESLASLDFEASLPAGFENPVIVSNPLGGVLDQGSLPGKIRIEGLELPEGTHVIHVSVDVGDLPGAKYRAQALLTGLPAFLGLYQISDDPATLKQKDSTTVEIKRVEADSIFMSNFLCLGETIRLDASAYGDQVFWNTGANGPEIIVDEGGLYRAEAVSDCQSVILVFQVISASCPFTIELEHTIEPEETLPCSEVLFSFIINNESGVSHNHITFIDTLPPGMRFVELIDPLSGGQLVTGPNDGIVRINGMQLAEGTSHLSFLVETGPVMPGTYTNNARIEGFPVEIGPIRVSDYPGTQEMDGSPVTIIGIGEDERTITQTICTGATIVLDGSPYGLQHQWDNGSTNPRRTVDRPGNYVLTVFDGCSTVEIVFEVEPAPPIDVAFASGIIEVRKGDSIDLIPQVTYEGDSLNIAWKDPVGNTLSCDRCLVPSVLTDQTGIYEIVVSDGVCADSARIQVRVDDSRIVYMPNIFSPNGDGKNDRFFFQSPENGIVESLHIFDRWGVRVFDAAPFPLNDSQGGWDGTYNGRRAQNGVYVWHAGIRYADGKQESRVGEVMVVR